MLNYKKIKVTLLTILIAVGCTFAEGTNKAWNDLKEAVHQAGEKLK